MIQPESTNMAVACPPQPLERLFLFVRLRLLPLFPEVGQSLTIVATWAREHLLWQRQQAADVKAIDDPLERVQPLLEQCLANDPPGKRQKILAALREVHANTERESAELTPHCTARFLDEAT